MKFITLIFFSVLFHTALNAQQFQYVKFYSSGDTYDQGQEVVELPDGLIIAASRTFGAANADIFLIRTNTSGDTLWTKRIGGNGYDYATSLVVLSNGNFLIGGYTNTPPVKGAYDAYLICTDNNGNMLWQKKYGGTQFDAFNQIKPLGDGFIMCGPTESFGAGDSDAWLLRTNLQGDSLWSTTFGGSEYDDAWDLELTPEGGFMITGGNYSFAAGLYDDAWLIKTSASGELIWRKSYGLIDRVDWAWALTPVMNGSSIEGYVFVGIKDTEEGLPGATQGDLHLVKVDTAGNVVWDKSIESVGISRLEGMDIKQTPDGSFIIAAEESLMDRIRLTMFRIDAGGNVNWTESIGDAYEAYEPRRMTLTSDGGCVITGRMFSQSAPPNIFYAKFGGLFASVSSAGQVYPLSIYPNPAKDKIRLEYSERVHINKVVLYNATGQVLETFSGSGSNSMELQLSGKRNGIFFLKVYTGEGISTQKILLQEG